MTDSELLHDAMFEAATILVSAVGLPADPDDLACAERRGAIVDRDQVPAIAWKAALSAIEFLAVGIGTTDPDAPAREQDPDEAFRPMLDHAAREAHDA